MRGAAGEVTVSPFYLFPVAVHLVLFLWTWKLCKVFVESFVFLVAIFHKNSRLRQVSDDIARVCMAVQGQMLYLQEGFCILFQTTDVIQN